jgi:uncharacterized SAM-binding protein YcdF (DUF218 family)
MSTRCPAQVNSTTAVTGREGSVFLLRPRRTLLLVFAALVLAWITATLVLFVFPSTDAPGKADAVVVLSGGRNSRLDPALNLMREGVAPLLVISGSGLDERWLKARRLCADGARGFRVLCFDPSPYSTRGEAETITRLAQTHGWQKVDVVTSRYHVFRARIIIGRCYHRQLTMIGTSAHPWDTFVSWFSEWSKLLYQLTVQRSC